MPQVEEGEGSDRCYICLAGEGEAPILSKSGDKGELISPCYCSLKAHKTCLVDWVMESGSNTLEERQIRFNQLNNRWSSSMNSVIGTGIGLDSSRRLFSSDDVKCAQCGHRITLLMKPSSVLTLDSFIRNIGSKLGRNALIASVTSIFGGSVFLALFSVLVSTGLRLYRLIAPESVLLKLLNISGGYRSFDSAVRDNKIEFSHMAILAEFPIYLYATRGEGQISQAITLLYPLSFFNILKDKVADVRGPRSFLLIFEGLRAIYSGVFALTFNRLYYRWVHRIRPFYSDGVSEEEYNEMQIENAKLNAFAIERLNKKKKHSDTKNLSILTRLYDWLFPDYSKEELEIIEKQKARELKLIFKNNYSKAFFKNSKGSTLITTLLWPFLGNTIGIILGKSTVLKRLINGIVATPDESTFVFNSIGCCLVVILKDLINLLIAYRQVQQFKNIEILHRGVEGFEQLHRQEINEQEAFGGQGPADVEDAEQDGDQAVAVQRALLDEAVARIAAVAMNVN